MLSSTYNPVNSNSQSIEDRVPKVTALLEQVRISKTTTVVEKNLPPSLLELEHRQMSDEDVFGDLEEDERESTVAVEYKGRTNVSVSTPFLMNRTGRFPLSDYKRRLQEKKMMKTTGDHGTSLPISSSQYPKSASLNEEEVFIYKYTPHKQHYERNKAHVLPKEQHQQESYMHSSSTHNNNNNNNNKSSTSDQQQLGNINEMNHPSILTLNQSQIEDLFVSMAAFAKLGFVQPPCCLRCAYRNCAAASDDDVNDDTLDPTFVVKNGCENLVLWRKNAGVLIQPSCMKENVIVVKVCMLLILLRLSFSILFTVSNYYIAS